MTDQELFQHLKNLAEAIRQLPAGKTHADVVDRFFAVIAHLELRGLIPSGQWDLGPRR